MLDKKHSLKSKEGVKYRQVVSFRPIKNSIAGAGFSGSAPGLSPGGTLRHKTKDEEKGGLRYDGKCWG
jgi:hypothetical protein